MAKYSTVVYSIQKLSRVWWLRTRFSCYKQTACIRGPVLFESMEALYVNVLGYMLSLYIGKTWSDSQTPKLKSKAVIRNLHAKQPGQNR